MLRYSNLYFTVHSLKVCTLGGGFHSISREPKSPGSVIWRSCGGATKLKTKQRVKEVVDVKKKRKKKVIKFDEMKNAAAGCRGKLGGCLIASTQQTRTTSPPAYAKTNSSCWYSKKTVKNHWRGTKMPQYLWHSLSNCYKQNCCPGMNFQVLQLLTYNLWYLPTAVRTSILAGIAFSTYTNIGWQITSCCQRNVYYLSITETNHPSCFKYSFQAYWRLVKETR